MLHIGNTIKNELQAQQQTVSWFAQQLCCNRQNVYNIFKRPSLDTDLLLRISQILHHDFFLDLSSHYNNQMPNPSHSTFPCHE